MTENARRLERFIDDLRTMELPSEVPAKERIRYVHKATRGMAAWLQYAGSKLDIHALAKSIDPTYEVERLEVDSDKVKRPAIVSDEFADAVWVGCRSAFLDAIAKRSEAAA